MHINQKHKHGRYTVKLTRKQITHLTKTIH